MITVKLFGRCRVGAWCGFRTPTIIIEHKSTPDINASHRAVVAFIGEQDSYNLLWYADALMKARYVCEPDVTSIRKPAALCAELLARMYDSRYSPRV